MTWFACGAAAVAVVSSAASASASAKSASKMSVAENEAVIKSNVKNTIRTGYRVGLLNMQRGLQKREAVQAGFNITKGGQEALGQVTANAAAAGTIGASADAVVADVRMKMGDAQAALVNQNEIAAGNFNTQLENITFEGEQAIQESRKFDIQSGSDITKNALMAGAMSLASSYAGSKMGAGVGKAPGGGAGITPQSSSLSSMGGGTGITGGGIQFKQYNWG